MNMKFRIWNSLLKEYVNKPQLAYSFETEEVSYIEQQNMEDGSFVDVHCTIPNYEIEEYIGLEDITGREMYEGDIVESSFRNTHDGTTTTDTYTIERDKVNPCYVLHSITNENVYEYDFVQVDLRTNKIIGTINEHNYAQG